MPRKRRWGRERRTWAMVRGGEAVRSRTHYILETDRRLFTNEAIRDPRYNSDHYMVMGLLRGGTAKAQDKYIARRRKVPMQPLRRPTREDELFGDLRRAVLKPQPREQHRNAWIPESSSSRVGLLSGCIGTFRLPATYLSCAFAVPPRRSPITM